MSAFIRVVIFKVRGDIHSPRVPKVHVEADLTNDSNVPPTSSMPFMASLVAGSRHGWGSRTETNMTSPGVKMSLSEPSYGALDVFGWR
jgi:hypothetical protein